MQAVSIEVYFRHLIWSCGVSCVSVRGYRSYSQARTGTTNTTLTRSTNTSTISPAVKR